MPQLASCLARFHLFEAGAFVTRSGPRSRSRSPSVSTYLKLELLSHDFERDLPGHGVTVRFHLFEAGAFVTSVFQSAPGAFSAFPPI